MPNQLKNPVPKEAKPNTAELLPLDEYEHILVSFSGGKDSLACWLHLLELGVPHRKIQLWHELVDGAVEPGERNFMDWPITEDYCNAVADMMGAHLRTISPAKHSKKRRRRPRSNLYFQWKEGGFEREMLRENEPTAGMCFDMQCGKNMCLPPGRPGKLGTRLKFPQLGPMTTRWCTSYLKIDVMARAISNEEDFKDAKILIVSGERREESNQRSTYAEVDKHKCNSKRRLVTQWRAVIDWSEYAVWKIIERWKINPHPCYHLGFGRCSCIACIYSRPDQWATVREIDPDLIRKIAAYEDEFGVTISRKKINVEEVADSGEPFPEIYGNDYQLKLAMGTKYPGEDVFDNDWELPIGAGRTTGGPT